MHTWTHIRFARKDHSLHTLTVNTQWLLTHTPCTQAVSSNKHTSLAQKYISNIEICFAIKKNVTCRGGETLTPFSTCTVIVSTYSVEPLPSMNRYNQVRNPSRMLTVHSTTEHGYTSLTQSIRQNYYTSNEHQNKLTTRNDSLFFTGWKDKNITAFTITSPWKDSRHHKNTAYWRTRGQNWMK